MHSLADTYQLVNGAGIPCVGFGTWELKDGDETVEAVKAAINNGYRHIDTAAIYENEKSVGQAIRESSVPREELFVTTKVWNTERGYYKTMEAFDASMEKLELDYLDMYLIHWPATRKHYSNWEEINKDTWLGLEELYQNKRVRAIGVCNFQSHHLASLLDTAKVKPMINQIEFHPGLLQQDTRHFCEQHNIMVEAWSPLGRGGLLKDKHLESIATRYDKNVAQLCVKWCLQHNTLPLPRSANSAHIMQNAKVFDFEINPEDMLAIDQVQGLWHSGLEPDKVDF